MRRKKEERVPTRRMCGWCQGAAETKDPAWSHSKCYSPERWPCACGALDHKFDAELAERMAAFCHIPVDDVYRRHGRKRRTMSDEQKAAATARLAQARAAKAGGGDPA